MPTARRVESRSAQEIRAVIEGFLANCRQPAVLEPGEDLLEIQTDNFALEFRGSRLALEAWDRARNFSRRVVAVRSQSAARLELVVERFGGREGQLFLLDLQRPAGMEAAKRGARLIFRERFGLFLRRQFPEWKLAELSAEANLEFSLSPAFPRGFLRHGRHGWAAIACPPEGDEAAALSFGLIWLAYLRERERRATVSGLAIYVPAGKERAVALRLICLDPNAARLELFSYSPQDYVARADPRDFGNLDTQLEPCRRPLPEDSANERWRSIIALPGVELVPKHNARAGLRVRGVEFAELAGKDLLFGGERQPAGEHQAAEIRSLVERLAAARSADAGDRQHPLYRGNPEAWLESQVRRHIEIIDPTLLPDPIYGQVPAFAGGERGVLDLLAVDRSGRLAVVELKASADLHLPLQALDYWIRVKWHLDRGEFGAQGYFPGIELRPEPPRLLLVSPSLEFHPTTEALLRFYAPEIEVERIGLGLEWRRGCEVMFRLTGAERPR
ncbi:MAG TPA: hypothetical protein VKV17_15205 [Bryobacteraceae bacterium]|nr:hypothetical protein [Bryobacteraceae bacterium]